MKVADFEALRDRLAELRLQTIEKMDAATAADDPLVANAQLALTAVEALIGTERPPPA